MSRYREGPPATNGRRIAVVYFDLDFSSGHFLENREQFTSRQRRRPRFRHLGFDATTNTDIQVSGCQAEAPIGRLHQHI